MFLFDKMYYLLVECFLFDALLFCWLCNKEKDNQYHIAPVYYMVENEKYVKKILP